MPVSIEQVAKFLFAYANRYRIEYLRAITSPPHGPGYPDIVKSPYLLESSLDVYIAQDGVVVVEEQEPNHQWFIAGGPAMKVDYEPTRTPDTVRSALVQMGLEGQNIGIYRIVAKAELPAAVWTGRIRSVTRRSKKSDRESGMTLNMVEVKTSMPALLQSLTFGAYGSILDLHLPDVTSQIGESHLTQNMGFFPSDLNSRRYFKRLEVFGQVDSCAWDTRTVNLRVQRDIRRDFAAALSDPAQEGGKISTGEAPAWVEAYTNRLEALQRAIAALRVALQFEGDGVEAVFHDVLAKHPLLIDVYGVCESKPTFSYPAGSTSPIGKTKLQPDFLVHYPNQTYKLIEIERPVKGIATAQGQPRAEVNQAVFQTAEWKHFIATHYAVLADRYPGIQARCQTAVIMSRTQQASFKSAEDMQQYIGLMLMQHQVDEFLTFDDLLQRATTALALLAGLSPHAAA